MLFLKGTTEHAQTLLAMPELVIDLETTGLNAREDRVLEVAINVPGQDAAYIFQPEDLALFTGYKGTWVGHNLVDFDQAFLLKYSIFMTPEATFDTMLVHHLLDENLSHRLDDIVQAQYQDNYKQLFWEKHKEYSDATEEARLEYAGKDVIYTGRLYLSLRDHITSTEISASLVSHVHHLAFTLAETSRRGVRVDLPYLTDLGVKLKTRLIELEPLMRATAELDIKAVEYDLWMKELEKRKTPKGRANVPKPEFNFGSPQQLASLLYDKVGLPRQYNKKSVTTDDVALETLAPMHPLAELLREQREKSKLYGTYIEGTTALLVKDRVYPRFRVNGTVTGRISHSDPNLGNLPRLGGYRGMYIPDDDMVIISADYSQLEVCIAAHYSQDPALLSIVLEGKSQHDITAASLGIDRQLAKPINFGMQYRASHFKVAKLLGVSEKEGKRVWDAYWKTYSGVKAQMDICDKMVDSGTPIVTLFGRKRRFEVKARSPWDSAYRQAWNAKVQGTGAEMTSISLYRTGEELKHRGWGFALWSVHDENLIAAKREYAVDAEKLLCETMIRMGKEVGLTVPLKVESSGPMERWMD